MEVIRLLLDLLATLATIGSLFFAAYKYMNGNVDSAHRWLTFAIYCRLTTLS